MKNTTSLLVTPNFFSIYCNGELVKTVFSIAKMQTSKQYQKAMKQLEELKWGVHENKDVQNKFDKVLNK